MSVPMRLAASLVLILVAAACSQDGTPAASGTATDATASPMARVEAVDVAERLLTQLRDEDHGAAYQTLSTGMARDYAANELELMTKLMSADTIVSDWSLEEPRYINVDEQSKVEIGGAVTFDDGASGRVRILMQALGLQADPWRVDDFELTRD